MDAHRTGYNVREGSAMLAERRAATAPVCVCGEVLSPDGTCLDVGRCNRADLDASRSSLRRGAAASARPAAWTGTGRVD